MVPGPPSPPEGFLNVTDVNESGFYFLGAPDFFAKDLPQTSIFKRSLTGSGEDVVLILFAVLSIVILHAIVFAVLLQRRFGRYSAGFFQVALLLHEYLNLKVWSRLHTPATGQEGHPRRKGLIAIAAVTFVLLLGADIGLVYLTVPKDKRSGRDEYNLKAIQPVGTTEEIARGIRASTQIQSCVTPVVPDVKQRRDFLLTGCIEYTRSTALLGEGDLSSQIIVGSWYHSSGSDHTVRFGPGRLSVQTRASIALPDRTRWQLGFETRDTRNQRAARFVQDVFLHEAIRWTCAQDFAQASCGRIGDELVANSRDENKTVVVGRSADGGQQTREVRGLVTTYDIALSAPFRGLREALRVLATSAVVQEVERGGLYVRTDGTGGVETGVGGLLAERVRVGGIVMYVVVVLGLLVVLLAVVVGVRPASMAAFAAKGAGGDAGTRADRVEDAGRAVGAETGDLRDDDSSYGAELQGQKEG